jgi:alkylation response protein AidB-like acyl-CoA dehydrogenase
MEDVKVPETAVGGKIPPQPLSAGPMLNVARWFHTMMSSVYLGIAEEARAEAYKAIGSGVNSNSRNDVLTDVLCGEMEAEFAIAASVRDQLTAKLEGMAAGDESLTVSTLLKEIVTTRAAATVDKAVEIAGGRAFFRKSPLERLARDVRAGRFHPPSAPISFQVIGERARRAAVTPAAVPA